MSDTKQLDTLAKIKETLSGVSLSFHWLGIQRSVGAEANQLMASAIEADSKAVSGKNVILDTKMQEWKELNAAKNAAKAAYDYMTFPYVIEGQRLFLQEQRGELWATMRSWEGKIQGLALKFAAKRDDIVAWAKKNLGKAFDETRYPQDLSTRFGLTLREVSIEPPSYLRHTNAEEYKRTLQRQLVDIQYSMQSFERQCMEQLGHSIGTLTSALSNETAIKGATIESMRKVFNRIATLKFEGTALFQASMKEAEAIIDGVDVDDLRRSSAACKDTNEKLARLLARHKELREASVKKAVAA